MFDNNFEKPVFKKRVLFLGIPDMALVCLDGLVSSGVNIVGVIGAKKSHPTYQSFKEFVLNKRLNFIEYDKLTDENFISEIKDLNADVAVVCSFNYKIPKVLLDSVKSGFINVHPSLLPDYRGKNPYSSVIVNGEKYSGITLHFMDEDFDTGDIIVQEKLEIHPKETMGTLFNRLNFLGFELLLKTLLTFEQSEISKTPQPKGDFIQSGDFSENNLFIDYNKPAKEIERFIRGLNPFFIASSLFRSTFVKIYSASVVEESSPNGVLPGTIVRIENDKFYVATKEGLLSPTVIQFGSFFTLAASEFIELMNLKIGERFGE